MKDDLNNQNNHRYDGIQALRFFAAFLVVVTHSTIYATQRLGVGGEPWGLGSKGVDIFFVISGLVMVISSRFLVGTFDGWKIFLKNRIVRIVPLYWGATTFKLVVLLMASSLVLHAELDWWYIIKSYFFIPSENVDGKILPLLGVGWTLVFEMFFYTVFTIALLLRKNIYIFVGVVLLAFSVASIFREENYSAWWFLMNSIILEFYMGMIVGYFALKNKHLPVSVALVTIAVSLFILFTPLSALQLPRFIASGIPAVMLVWSFVSLEKYLQGRIPRFIMFYGAASYALYLFHPLIAPLAPEILKRLFIGNFTLSVLFSISIAMVASAVVYRWFEVPVTNYLRK